MVTPEYQIIKRKDKKIVANVFTISIFSKFYISRFLGG